MGYLSELLLAKSRTKSFRLYLTAPIFTVADAAKSLPKRNALTLIHKTASLPPSTLSPAPSIQQNRKTGCLGGQRRHFHIRTVWMISAACDRQKLRVRDSNRPSDITASKLTGPIENKDLSDYSRVSPSRAISSTRF